MRTCNNFSWRTDFDIVNDAKFSSLFHLIGQIYTNLDNLAPVDSINIENFTQNFRHSGTLTMQSKNNALWLANQKYAGKSIISFDSHVTEFSDLVDL